MFEALPDVAMHGIETANLLAAGPPADLPGPVPDFVGSIHEHVRAFLDGSLDSLGGAVSETASGANPGPGGA